MERMSAKQFQTYFKKEKKGKKYNNRKLVLDNKKFDSQSEADLYVELKQQEKQGLIESFETQVKEELFAYDVHICNYYVDFKVYLPDGQIQYIEHKSKGTVTASWRIKYKMLEAKYKEDKNIEIRINWYRGYKIINRK